jgi:quercetin dioxygenase-like cupin family protein
VYLPRVSVPTDRRGQRFDNPVTGETVVLITDPRIHPDGVLVGQLTVAPGGRVAAPHRHATLTERFVVLAGRITFLIGGEEHDLGPGDRAEVPPGTVHDWWQVGSETAEVVAEVDPGELFTQVVGTMFGLARDGKSDRKGVPRPLQLAVSMSAYRDVIELTSPPPALQKAIFAPLAALGRARGLKPYYEEYVNSADVVEPDPRALALLGENGRLAPAPTA